MIQKLTPPDQPYHRPHDKTQQVSVLLTVDDGSTDLQIRKTSLRSRRSQFTFAVTAFVVGAIFILTNSSARNDFLAPGDLISPHAQILAEQNADRCAACHSEASAGWGEWVTGIFRSDRKVRACQSQLCMECHKKSLNDAWATQPHNLDPNKLQQLTENACRRRGDHVDSVFPSPLDEFNKIECSACHREHHGAKDLARLTDQQCQACHAERYRQFESDHPEFVSWPQQRRQVIAFDHASHGFKHFPAKGSTFDCQACHVDGDFQSVKTLVPFEQACAQCHGDTVVDRHAGGIAFVGLPMLDLDAIGENKLSVGQWPDGATGDFDGQLSPIMRLLLFDDKGAQEVLTRRGADFEFADLDPGDSKDVADAVELVWAIKFLLHDLSVGGSDALYDRLQKVLKRSIAPDDVQRLMAGLNRDVILAATDRWLPQLAEEVAAKRNQDPVLEIARKFSETKPLLNVVPTFEDEEDELVANPLKHYASAPSQPGRSEPVGAEGLDGPTQGLPRVEPEPAAKNESWLKSDRSTARDEANLETVRPAKPNTNEMDLNAVAPREQQDVRLEDDLLVTNPLAGNVKPAQTRPAQQPGGDDRESAGVQRPGDFETAGQTPLRPKTRPPVQQNPQEWLADNPLSGNLSHENASSPALNAEQTQQLVQELSQAIRESESEAHEEGPSLVQREQSTQAERSFPTTQRGHQNTVLRAWQRDDQLFQISYQPNGHADVFLQQWMIVLAKTPEADQRPSTAHFFDQMTSGASFGKCYQCHTINRESDQSFTVNWTAQYRDPMLRGFTKFSHRPHLVQPKLADCSHCHALDPERTNAHTFTTRDRSDVLSNFLPIQKANCVSCHHEGSTNNSCMQCHHYHIGSRISARK